MNPPSSAPKSARVLPAGGSEVARRPWRFRMRRLRDELIVGLIVGVISSLASSYFENSSYEERAAEQARQPGEPVEVIMTQPRSPGTWGHRRSDRFDIFILAQEYRWGLGTTDVLGPDGQSVEMGRKMDELIRQYDMEYGDLIAVGTASCEGDSREESDRALDRADRLVLWMREAFSRARDRRERHHHTLNLGKFRSCDGVAGRTDDQRRIILAAVRTPGNSRTLSSDLWHLMARERPFGFHPDDYSKFVLDRWSERP